MTEPGICPGCGRHCDLTEPHCGRGAAYLRGEAQTPPEALPRHQNPNDRLIDALRDLGRMMRAQYEGRASQKRILMILRDLEGITQRDLTERLGIQPGSASEILAKLENAGLIVRTQNTEDRRTTDVQLTGSGRALAEEAAGQRRERHEEMFSCLSEEEKQTLLALLEKLCADWNGRYQSRPYAQERHDPPEGHEHHGRREHHGHHEHPRRHGGPGRRGRG